MTKQISLFFLLAGLAFAGHSRYRDEYTRNFDKTLSIPNGARVSIENRFGDITVRTHPQQDVVIHAEIHVSASDSKEAKEYADRVEILVEPSAELFIQTKYPETPKSFFGIHDISFSVRYEVTIPESSPLRARNAFGAVLAAGLKAGSDIVTSHGDLKLRDSRGTERLENSFAAIEVDHNVGDVTVETTNGAVTAGDVTGSLSVRDRFASVKVARVSNRLSITNGNGSVDVSDCGAEAEIRTSFGAVTVQNVRGGLTVDNQNGRVDATNTSGPTTLHTSFAAVNFSEIGGSLSIRSNNGAITGNKVSGSLTVVASFGAVQVSDIQQEAHIETQNAEVTVDKTGGPAQIKTSFGAVRATNIGGELTVNAVNGSVHASTTKGAQVTTSFGGVSLDGIAGPVSVQNQNGSVEVASALRNTCEPIDIRTSFGAIRVKLPPDASYRVAARTSMSKIRSDFPLTVQGSLESDAVNGTIGAGKCDMNLTDQNGSIEILKF